jgi:nicotinate-nucleotide pyrophosphorylase (carboxylating)
MLPGHKYIWRDVRIVLDEDVGSGDLTASLVPQDKQIQARVICREQAVVCGIAWFNEVFSQLDPDVEVDWDVQDGDTMLPDQEICCLRGRAASILTGERSALNLLQTLSGTATLTSSYVKAIAGTDANILDTRKTIPGLRLAQKYAVLCGGGKNHRKGLYDAILIKENHILAAGSITAALQQAQETASGVEIEVEVENLSQLGEALGAGTKRVLLDNFELEALRQAVQLNAGRARLEASGGVNLDTVRQIAETGVNDISVGALTKDLRAVDFSMRFTND